MLAVLRVHVEGHPERRARWRVPGVDERRSVRGRRVGVGAQAVEIEQVEVVVIERDRERLAEAVRVAHHDLETNVDAGMNDRGVRDRKRVAPAGGLRGRRLLSEQPRGGKQDDGREKCDAHATKIPEAARFLLAERVAG